MVWQPLGTGYRRWMRKFIWVVVILVAMVTLITPPAIAAISQLEEAPGTILYRSQQRLQDQTGRTWQVVLFKQIYPDHTASVQLRLVGLPGAAEVAHPKPLKLQVNGRFVVTAADVFLQEAPAPSVGQYNVEPVIAELPADDLLMSIPLIGDRSLRVQVPRSVVQEWQDVAKQGSLEEKP